MKKFPDVIYVMLDKDSTYLLAYSSADSAACGRVATYRLVEEYEKREVTEFRRKGTKQWAKTTKTD